MQFIRILLVVLLAINLVSAICPPAEDLLPCTCKEPRDSEIRCEGIQTRFDIKSHFEKVSLLVESDVIFDKLILRENTFFEIPAGTFQNLKFKAIDISYNHGLDYISPDAFNQTLQITTDLSLWNNHLGQPPTGVSERELYDFLNKFTNVESIWMPSNGITSIPANAFGPLNALNDIYYGSNSVSSIGDFAFSQLPNLTKVYLSYSSLTSEGITNNTFVGVGPKVDMDLQHNLNIKFLDEGKFKPLLDGALKVGVGGSSCGHNGCSYDYLDCDQRADWICANEDKYKDKLCGFLCIGSLYEDIWEYCAATSK